MRIRQELVEGWTAPLDFQLKLVDPQTKVATDFDLTGLALPAIRAHNQTGSVIPLVGLMTIVDLVTGKIRFTPDAADLVKALSPYFVRFEIADVNGKLAFWPNNIAMEWVIRK